jgi:tRNA (mo5U34)-methyltransferase
LISFELQLGFAISREDPLARSEREEIVKIQTTEMLSPETLAQRAKEFYWYHCMNLGNGVITDGDYDLTDLLPRYGFPDRMDNMTALDIGRASGFFAFEFERRGAAVTATDLPSYLDWDFVGGEEQQQLKRAQIGDPDCYSVTHLTGAFEFAHQVMGSNVVGKLINVYDLSPSAFDGKKFDLVFAGSIASHVRDPILAFERLRSVAKRKCIVAAPSFEIAAVAGLPMMHLIGTADSDRRSWWVLNEPCLVEMLRCAGFARAEIVSRMTIVNRRIPSLRVDHIVAHAEVE